MTIGNRIKKAREALNITQEELAQSIGTTKQTIYKYENNIVTNIPSDKIEGISNILHVSPSYLMGWSNSGLTSAIDGITNISVPAARAIPILGSICAGNGIFCEENYDGFFFVDNSIRADLCLNVKGDSMIESDIYDGDKAFICQNCLIEDGRIYAVRIKNDSEAVLKRVFRQDENVVLSSSNPDYAPIIEKAENVSIIGECIGVYHAVRRK